MLMGYEFHGTFTVLEKIDGFSIRFMMIRSYMWLL
jgi:hypothetical protein